VRAARGALQRATGRDVHHDPAPALHHVARQRLRAEHGSKQIDRQHRTPGLGRDVEDSSTWKDPGIVDEAEHAVEARNGLIRGLRDLSGVGDVDLSGDDVDAHLRTLVGGLRQTVLQHIPERQHRAATRQLDGDGAANALRGTRDNDGVSDPKPGHLFAVPVRGALERSGSCVHTGLQSRITSTGTSTIIG
jgi:hypothetical protein